MHILNGNILRIRDVCQSRALGILVGALWVPFSANPELLPIVEAIAVDSSLSSNGEAVKTVSIDQSDKILTRLTLNAGGGDRKVADTVGA